MFSTMTFAQNTIKELTEVEVIPPKFMMVDEFNKTVPGNIYSFLAGQLTSIEESQMNYEGVSVISFTVSTEGVLNDFEIINSIFYKADEAIIKALASSNGMWKPGTNNGEATPMEQMITVAIVKGEVDKESLTADFYRNAKHFYIKGNKNMYVKENYKRALRKYNMSLRYVPNDVAVLLSRGLCLYELGRVDAAIKDWQRIKALGGEDWEGVFVTEFRSLEGYDEFLAFMAN